ncbi:hypothetical protein IJL65_00300 [bacterium]|nr:hypothetical protein [bacterium]
MKSSADQFRENVCCFCVMVFIVGMLKERLKSTVKVIVADFSSSPSLFSIATFKVYVPSTKSVMDRD